MKSALIDVTALRRGLLEDIETTRVRWAATHTDATFDRGYWEGLMHGLIAVVYVLEKSMLVDTMLEATKNVTRLPARPKEN